MNGDDEYLFARGSGEEDIELGTAEVQEDIEDGAIRNIESATLWSIRLVNMKSSQTYNQN